MLADVYLEEERPDDALALLRPLEEPFGERYEIVAGIGLAVYLKGEYADAALYLERARGIRPPDTMLLNALGDCYQHLGDTEKASEAFERSLELDADQPSVRERLSSFGAEPS
jgi:Flp pilus assembly protein TadD